MTIFLVIGFALPVLAAMSIYNAQLEGMRDAQNAALLLERKYYVEKDIKDAFLQSMQIAARQAGAASTREDVAVAVAERLEAFERFAEGAYAQQGVEVDLWFGPLDDADALAKRIYDSGRLQQCDACADFSSKTITYSKKIAPAAVSFINVDPLRKRVEISKGGLTIAPNANALGRVYFGASVLMREPRIAFVVALPEGSGVDYA